MTRVDGRADRRCRCVASAVADPSGRVSIITPNCRRFEGWYDAPRSPLSFRHTAGSGGTTVVGRIASARVAQLFQRKPVS